MVFLGTGGSLPTKDRGLPAVAIRRDGELILFDCGEGTQRQMMHAGLGFNRPTAVFVSHLHGDHLLGLPGLLQTMSSLVRDKPLDLYGPKGLSSFFKSLHGTLGFAAAFPLRITELSPGDKVDRTDYMIRTDGKTVSPNLVTGPARPGLKVTYAIDTRPTQSVRQLALGSDLLMHDGGFALDRKDKAREYFHSTAMEAASVAKASKSKKLALVHISAVTRDDRILLREARKVFRNTIVPRDLMVVSLKRSP